MGAYFLDTNVLLYAVLPILLPADEPKRAIARDLIEGEFCLSGQVMAEFYYNALKKGGGSLTPEQTLDWLDRLSEYPCAPIDAALVRTGAKLSRKHQISYWDGAVLAAAHELGASTLYTEDLNDGQRYGDVLVVDPFKNITH